MLTSRKPGAEPARLLTVDEVAGLLGVSTRHVWRLADGGRMPPPLRLGGARRWDRQTIEDWIANGCPEESGAGRRQDGRR